MLDGLRTALAAALMPGQRRGPMRVPLLSQMVQLAAGSWRTVENPRARPRTVDGPGDYHLDDYSREYMRNQSREIERDCDYYDGLLGNWSMILVGSGPVPVPAVSDQDWQAQALELWREDAAAKRLDASGREPWGPWVRMLARSIARDGEAFPWHSGSGSALIIEADGIARIEHDTAGRALSYLPIRRDRRGLRAGHGDPLLPSRIDHLAWRTRASQTRGAPVCASGLDDWSSLNSLFESETIAAESASLPWVLIEHQGPSPVGGFVGGNPSTANGGAGPDGPTGRAIPPGWQRTDAGSMMGLPPGLKGTAWAPERPNLDVPDFVKARLRYLCAPLLPYEVAFQDIGALSYAAIRGVKRLAEERLAAWRGPILEPTCTRIWRDWCRSLILAKKLSWVSGWDRVTWRWPELAISDREKDALADERELRNGTATLQDLIGPDWQRTVDQQVVEWARRVRQVARALADLRGDPEPAPADIAAAVKALPPAPQPVTGIPTVQQLITSEVSP